MIYRMEYNQLVDKGSGNHPLTVYMYPNTTNDEDLAGPTAKDVFDYLAAVLVNDTILDRMSVYEITSSEDYPQS